MQKKYFFRAQASIEMVFGMIMIVLMVFSVLKIGLWAGLEMAEVQKNHDDTLTAVAKLNGNAPGDWGSGPMGQVDPIPFHKPLKMDAVWKY